MDAMSSIPSSPSSYLESCILTYAQQHEELLLRLAELDSLADNIHPCMMKDVLVREVEKTQKELEQMYENIFAGPNEDFLDEDDAELDYMTCQQECSDAKTQYRACGDMLYALRRAEMLMLCTCQAMTSASQFGRLEYRIGKSSSGYGRAIAYSSNAVELFAEARAKDPAFPYELKVPDLERALQDKNSEIPVKGFQDATRRLQADKAEVLETYMSQRKNLRNLERKLERAKRDLIATRRAIFLDVVGYNRQSRGLEATDLHEETLPTYSLISGIEV